MKNFKKMIIEHFSEDVWKELKLQYTLNPVYALRLNKDKEIKLPFNLKTSNLNENLFILDDLRIAVAHPYHHGGAYYIQDPSSSLAVHFMELKEDDYVLDLAAAPGGKSTQILNLIPKGFLLANEIHPKRNVKLQNNLMRWGMENFAVSQNDGRSLGPLLNNSFDKVLLDAPCSGEGLFRRKQAQVQDFNYKSSIEFQKLQLELLESAYSACKDEGIIIYSTCTLNPFENEDVIKSFLEKHPHCKLIPIDHPLKSASLRELKETARFFPSKDGEGHFIAKIRVIKENSKDNKLHFSTKKEVFHNKDYCLEDVFLLRDQARVFIKKKQGFLKNKNINFTLQGLLLGLEEKSHFNYSNWIAHSNNFGDLFPFVDLDLDEAYEFLYGLSINGSHKSYHIARYQGLGLGLLKGNGQRMNNRYPKALRNRFKTYD